MFVPLRALEFACPTTWSLTSVSLVHRCARAGHTGHRKVPSSQRETHRAGPRGDWNLVILMDVVVRVHLHLGVGGVERNGIVVVERTGR